MKAAQQHINLLLMALFIIAASMMLILPSRAQTITNTGFCNIIIQGNNNAGVYVNYCRGTSAPSESPFDPPTLWLGMDIPTAKSLLGARNPDEKSENGLTILEARGTLFGLPGKTRYGFNASGKLSWMSVENQCSEVKYDYLLTSRPSDLNSSWEKWRNSSDIRLLYDRPTSCSNILDAWDTLKKLFGDPTYDRNANELFAPNESQICSGITQHPSQPCRDAGALRYTFIRHFIGADRLTGIGIVLRKLYLHGVVQLGSYTPQSQRQEIAGIVSVWGSDGEPSIVSTFGGPYAEFLRQGDVY